MWIYKSFDFPQKYIVDFIKDGNISSNFHIPIIGCEFKLVAKLESASVSHAYFTNELNEENRICSNSTNK